MTRYRIEAEAESEHAAKMLRNIIEEDPGMTLSAFDPDQSANAGKGGR